jgi:hypothetical protein
VLPLAVLLESSAGAVLLPAAAPRVPPESGAVAALMPPPRHALLSSLPGLARLPPSSPTRQSGFFPPVASGIPLGTAVGPLLLLERAVAEAEAETATSRRSRP